MWLLDWMIPGAIALVCDGDQHTGRRVLTVADLQKRYEERMKPYERVRERLARIDDGRSGADFGAGSRATAPDRMPSASV